MTNLQLYLIALQKTWWIWLPVVLGIIWTGFYEAIETKWERRVNRG